MKTIFMIAGIILIISGAYFTVIGIANYISKQVARYLQKNNLSRV